MTYRAMSAPNLKLPVFKTKTSCLHVSPFLSTSNRLWRKVSLLEPYTVRATLPSSANLKIAAPQDRPALPHLPWEVNAS